MSEGGLWRDTDPLSIRDDDIDHHHSPTCPIFDFIIPDISHIDAVYFNVYTKDTRNHIAVNQNSISCNFLLLPDFRDSTNLLLKIFYIYSILTWDIEV